MPSSSISVVIPAYNSSQTIVDALDSVCLQETTVHEIIVVDDLSTDNTVEVVQQWQLSHSETELVLIEQNKNSGPAGARNKGVEVSSGDWIAFLDSDDSWLPSKLTIQLRYATADSSLALVCGETIPLIVQKQSSDRGNASCSNISTKEFSIEDFVSHNPIATSTVLVKRDVLVSLSGFDEQFCGPEDYDLWLRLVSEHKCLHLDVPLSRYRHIVGSLSMDDRKFLPQVLRVLEKAFKEGGALCSHQEFRRRAYAEQYSSASWMAYNRGANLVALKLLLASWLYDMRRLHKEQQDPGLRIKLLVRYLFQRNI